MIRSVRVVRRDLPLARPFRIAYGTATSEPNVFLQVETSDGLVGTGAAAPDPEVTRETPEQVEKALQQAAALLRGRDEEKINFISDELELAPWIGTSAQAAVNIALYDLLGKRAGLPVYKLLGYYRDRVLTSYTIGIESLEATVERAKEAVGKGFRALKIKIGKDAAADIDRVRAVREAVGPGVSLRLDANQGYTVAEAKWVVKALDEVDIDILEQPTPKADLDKLKDITGAVNIFVMADESVLSLRDSFVIAAGGVADLLNIKLMKTGGLTAALKVHGVAQAGGLECMVGCMGESRASLTAGLHLALSGKAVKHADLDSHFDVTGDPARGGLRFEDGYLYPVPRPGFGTEVDL